ncbi:NAD-dependent deacetylase [Methylocella sp.]|uniref:SIR2 family NAD-dependent protein deacylase n=1 Tax=Methylocella sp. TaxID=1978226 RepID=UPI0035B37D2B
MVLSGLSDAQAALAEAIGAASRIVAFTGAGVSTECGVPDFRSKDSPWRRLPPIPYDLFVADELMREEAWRRKFALDDIYARASPGRGHYALANLAALNEENSIVTQNIDNLHQTSGAPPDRVIELHGNGTYARCLACGLRYELAPIRLEFEASGRVPLCGCGGYVKSATISFGQPMPQEALARACEAAVACDLFLAIGSSLVVYPAAALPTLAREHDARLIIVNGEETPLDYEAELVLRGDIGDILQPFAS